MGESRIETDVLVIGGGIAGAFAAIRAKEAGIGDVTLLSKGKLGKDSISSFAAGVYRALFPEDRREEWFKKIALSDGLGAGLYDEDWLNVWLDESYQTILDMERWGVQWEKTAEGEFERKIARWNIPVVMFHGPQMMEAMSRKVVSCGVRVIGHTMVTDLLKEKGGSGNPTTGVVGFNVRTGEFMVLKAKATVLAAGACGFKSRFSGHRFQTGDASAMAYRAGAVLGGFERGEVLHTTATDFDIHGLNMFIALGGRFVNGRGEQFLLEYDPELGNHTTMGRVSEASAMEVRAGRGPIALDMTHFSPEHVNKLKVVLPAVTRIMERAGVLTGDRIVKKMEWAPAFYGTIASGGGVVVNTKCETSLSGFYACGDAMVRLGSLPRALAGAAVSGSRAGRFASEYAEMAEAPGIDENQVKLLKGSAFYPFGRGGGVDVEHVILGLHEALLPCGVTVISRGDRMEKALKRIETIKEKELPLLYASDAHGLRVANEVRNMVLVAEMYLKSRLLREESRDSYLREDFPYTDNVNWVKWTRLQERGGEMVLWTEDVPAENALKPKRGRVLHPVFDVARKKGVAWG